MDWFETSSNLFLSGVIVTLIIAIIAYLIGGDVENPTKGFAAVAIASVLTGIVSIFIIGIYLGLWALTRSPEWLFFLSMILIAGGIAAFLVGALSMSAVFSDIIDVVYDEN